MAQSPCFTLWQFPFVPFLFPITYLETLLGVIGSRPPWSQVTRKLTSLFSTPPQSKFPASLLRFPQRPAPTKMTTRSRLPESGTLPPKVPWTVEYFCTIKDSPLGPPHCSLQAEVYSYRGQSHLEEYFSKKDTQLPSSSLLESIELPNFYFVSVRSSLRLPFHDLRASWIFLKTFSLI